MDDAELLPLRFSVGGIELRLLLKRLKPAFPRLKKTVAGSRARLVVTADGGLLLQIPGAESRTACLASAAFTVELPLGEVMDWQKETFRDSEQVAFAFGPGQMRFRSMTFSNESIHAWRPGEQPEPLTQSAEPMQTAIGHPLLATYHTLRLHPDETFSGNPVLGPAKVQIDSILDRAAKLLAPFGVDRVRLERVLDSMKD